jgi:thiosulfate/3-mercaptopyruvate sulfurtransferase
LSESRLSNMAHPLISVTDLHNKLNQDSLRVLDVRTVVTDATAGLNLYLDDHIPGAIYLSLDQDLSAASGPGRHPLPTPNDFRATLEAAGVGPEHHVVCYDDLSGAIAARLWWMLEHIGHTNVQVLDGGYPHWQGAGLPTSAGVSRYQRTKWESGPVTNPIVDRDAVLSMLGTSIVLDARAPERYAGEHEPLDAIAGHIPSAVCAHLVNNLRDGRFKPPEELQAMFAAHGVTSAEGVINSCGSGVTACHNILAMRVAGLGQGTLYPGSWSDWSSSGLAVALGLEPGSPSL